MKTKFTLLAVLMVALSSLNAQQIPNSGFETWTGAGVVSGWATMESIFAGFGVSGFTFKDSVDKAAGSASAKIVTDTVAGQPQAGIVSGFVSTGIGTYVPAQPIAFTGIAFTGRPDTLIFSYKYSSPGADTAGFQIFLTDTGSIFQGGDFLFATNTWTEISLALTPYYNNSRTPDTLLLQFFSSFKGPGTQGVIGSTLHVDGVRFGYVTPSAINEVGQDVAINVYPNPTSGEINITSSKSLAGNNIEIFNLTGQTVLKNVLTSSNLNVSSLANGTYIYRITDKEGATVTQSKLVILK